MKKTLIVVGIFILAMTVTAGIFWGCNSYSTPDRISAVVNSQPDNQNPGVSAVSCMITDRDGKASALRSALTKANVAAAREWLKAQGYSPVDSCVAVFVQLNYDSVSTTAAGPVVYRPHPDVLPKTFLRSADTMVWQAFANPTHDMGNYTGIATAWRNSGPSETILAELDISTSRPRVIRQGRFDDGGFEPGDVGVESFKECVGDCVMGAIVGCAIAGPGYLECVGAAATGCVIYCGAKAIWNAIFN